ncbi:hypothetical protein GALL_345970 [mine drainage metagenome]|uniref:Uncharacterized protein n=1 Tax=mine drainage metagenome TaxID=410659 RepID=A0A1J5QJ96_9ZZZZ
MGAYTDDLRTRQTEQELGCRVPLTDPPAGVQNNRCVRGVLKQGRELATSHLACELGRSGVERPARVAGHGRTATSDDLVATTHGHHDSV